MKKQKKTEESSICENLPINTKNEDNLIWLRMILLLADLMDNEWEQFRILASTKPKSPELIKYFDKLFSKGFNEVILNKDTKVFRARVIKSTNYKNFDTYQKNIYNEIFDIFLSKEEQNLNINNIQFSKDKLMLVNILSNGISKEQQDKLNQILTKYSQNDFYGFDKNESGIPAIKFRKDGRFNDKKDEYIYFSLEKDTCLYEMRPSIHQ